MRLRADFGQRDEIEVCCQKIWAILGVKGGGRMAISDINDNRQGGQYQQVHLLARQLKAQAAEKKK